MGKYHRNSPYSNVVEVVLVQVQKLEITNVRALEQDYVISLYWTMNYYDGNSYTVVVTRSGSTTSYTTTSPSIKIAGLKKGEEIVVQIIASSPYYNTSDPETLTLKAVNKGIGAMIIEDDFIVSQDANDIIPIGEAELGSTLVVG